MTVRAARVAGALALMTGAACATHRVPNRSVAPLFTGNGCGTNRLRNQFDGSWQEVRSAQFTYCVPPDFIPKDDGMYWDSRYTRFAWGQDARVSIGRPRSIGAIVASGRDIVGPGDRSDDARFPEAIDGEPVLVTVFKSDNDYYLEATFRTAKLGVFYGKSSREAGVDVLRAVLRSIHFTR